jgi:hypothetical protein
MDRMWYIAGSKISPSHTNPLSQNIDALLLPNRFGNSPELPPVRPHRDPAGRHCHEEGPVPGLDRRVVQGHVGKVGRQSRARCHAGVQARVASFRVVLASRTLAFQPIELRLDPRLLPSNFLQGHHGRWDRRCHSPRWVPRLTSR